MPEFAINRHEFTDAITDPEFTEKIAGMFCHTQTTGREGGMWIVKETPDEMTASGLYLPRSAQENSGHDPRNTLNVPHPEAIGAIFHTHPDQHMSPSDSQANYYSYPSFRDLQHLAANDDYGEEQGFISGVVSADPYRPGNGWLRIFRALPREFDADRLFDSRDDYRRSSANGYTDVYLEHQGIAEAELHITPGNDMFDPKIYAAPLGSTLQDEMDRLFPDQPL